MGVFNGALHPDWPEILLFFNFVDFTLLLFDDSADQVIKQRPFCNNARDRFKRSWFDPPSCRPEPPHNLTLIDRLKFEYWSALIDDDAILQVLENVRSAPDDNFRRLAANQTPEFVHKRTDAFFALSPRQFVKAVQYEPDLAVANHLFQGAYIDGFRKVRSDSFQGIGDAAEEPLFARSIGTEGKHYRGVGDGIALNYLAKDKVGFSTCRLARNNRQRPWLTLQPLS